ncbi:MULTISPECIES: hypothetical protein [Weeksella]|uniref:hypothetical protein n=1 Tax=Weeksella TaxID=1013 RepID=UPI0008A4BCF3|nr:MULTISPECIES: hypothetical protein [Weeksella]MDK7375985.1 hypothetical protein [Weeksella virosa]OFM84579.1 hypothetical protein HMPREF2660_08695 [Weeksella sp. HMSC059D05]
MKPLNYINALRRMRELTDNGVPFDFEFVKMNGEIKVVSNAVLRKGYRNNQSDRAKFLIAYKDLDTGEDRQFHRSLLLKVKGYKVII